MVQTPSLMSQLIARYLQSQGQQGGNPVQGALGTANTVSGGIKDFGSLAKLTGHSTSLGGLLGPGLGQVGGSLAGDILPGIGAATGIYGMIKNKGNLSNILSGAGTGASIGSMIVPGLGTLVGGGLGALAGGVEDLFNIGKPSQQELQGRDATTALKQTLASSATPAQLAEAQKAVASGAWGDTSGPLEIITTRDALIKQGMNPQQADQQAQSMVKNSWGAEKQGGSAVMNNFSPIQSFLQGQNGTQSNNAGQANAQQPQSTGGGGQIQGQLPYKTDAFSAGANRG